MTQLITNLDDAFEVKSKIEYLKKHYSGENDILLGVIEDTEEGHYKAYWLINEFIEEQESGWVVGEKINGKEIELISKRVDQIQDFEMPDHLQQIKAPNVWETIEQMEERTGKKCTGSRKNYITVAVSRRFVNPLNNIPPMVDDEINGWVPADAVKVHDDVRDQVGG